VAIEHTAALFYSWSIRYIVNRAPVTGWSQETTQQSIKTAAEVVIPDSDNDMDSDDESIPDGSLTRDQLLDRYRKKPLLATFTGTKGNGPMATVEVVPAVPVVKMEVDRGEGKVP